MTDATVMLAAIKAGDPNAAEKLLVIVYDELRRLAASKLAQESPGQTLQPTALVHEAWLSLVGDQSPSFKDREHFFRASAEAMRHILIDRARRRRAVRHGGEYRRVDIGGECGVGQTCVGTSRASGVGQAEVFCGPDDSGILRGNGNFSIHSQELLGLRPCLAAGRNRERKKGLI
jgi:hypothetical protein